MTIMLRTRPWAAALLLALSTLPAAWAQAVATPAPMSL